MTKQLLLTLTLILSLGMTVFAGDNCELQPKFSYKTKSLTVSFKNKTKGSFERVEWNFGDGNVSKDSNPIHTYIQAGTYVFNLTVFNKDCKNSFSGKIYVFDTSIFKNTTKKDVTTTLSEKTKPFAKTAVQENNSIQKIKNYPNPFSTSTNITFQLAKTAHTQVSIYDINGQLVTTLANEVMASGEHQLNFDGSNLAAGNYIIQVSTDQDVNTQKMTIQ